VTNEKERLRGETTKSEGTCGGTGGGTFLLTTLLLYYTFRLSTNWHVAVVLKNNEFSVTISCLLYCLRVICSFFCVQCSNPAELPTLVCSYTKVVRNNVYYMHRMKMQWLCQ